MSNECLTKREQFYHNEPEGDIIYEGFDMMTTIERTDDQLVIKVLLPKKIDWLALSDQLWCEVRAISSWAWDLMHRERLTSFDSIEPIQTLESTEEAYWKLSDKERQDDLYLYFTDDYNWVMYENDEFYLFRYDLHKDDHRLLVRNEVEAMHFWPKDDVGAMVGFLRRWYYRVTGDSEEEAQD